MIADDFSRHLDDFNRRLEEYRGIIRATRGNKHAFISEIILHGELNEENFNNNCLKIENMEGEADFSMITLIRLLYILKSLSFSINFDARPVIERIENCLEKFPFWPKSGTRHPDTICFWSENHIFM